MTAIDEARAVEHLMDLLRVPGLSGQEGRVAKAVRSKLRAAGCRADWIGEDDAHRRLGAGFETGNLIVKLPGTRRAPRILFSSHLDTVPLCRGAEPVIRGRRIVARGRTALGADNRTAVACLVTLAETLLGARIPHPPITLLFTIAEEIGLHGAKRVRRRDLGNPHLGFNYDAGDPAELTIGAIGAWRWTAEVIGRSAHAGVHPEQGISAVLIAARAVAAVAENGYFGKIAKGRRRGTSNVGGIAGGEATNQVTDRVELIGECRSHDPAFVETIVEAYRGAFARAAASVTNAAGRAGKVIFRAARDHEAFALPAADPVVRAAIEGAKRIGLSPVTRVVDGGLDANCFNRKGIPTVTLGAGQHNPHTVDEYADIREYLDGCRLAVAIAAAGR